MVCRSGRALQALFARSTAKSARTPSLQALETPKRYILRAELISYLPQTGGSAFCRHWRAYSRMLESLQKKSIVKCRQGSYLLYLYAVLNQTFMDVILPGIPNFHVPLSSCFRSVKSSEVVKWKLSVGSNRSCEKGTSGSISRIPTRVHTERRDSLPERMTTIDAVNRFGKLLYAQGEVEDGDVTDLALARA